MNRINAKCPHGERGGDSRVGQLLRNIQPREEASNEGSEPSRSSMRRARASSKFSPWLGLGRRSASYWRWSVPSWSATKSKLPKQKLWSGWKAGGVHDPARGARFVLALATPMLLKIFRRQGDEYFVSDIVVGFAEEET